jgi:branched-chain amino acid transport system substrate-binding protein
MTKSALHPVLAAAIAAWALSSAAAPATGEPIPIAGSFDLSGAAADVGKDVLDGVEFAVESVNKNGGVMGRPLKLTYQDNGTNPARAVNQATSLVQGGAKFLLSPQSSASAIAVSKAVSGKLRMPTCANSANSDDITIKDFQPYIFQIGANSYMEMRALAKRLAAQPYKRYAVIAADYAGGRSGANRFKEFIKELNPQSEIVVEEYPKFGAPDYTATINKVAAAKPDYVFTMLFGADLLAFSKQASAIGFFKQVNNHFVALYDGNTLKALGDYAPVGTEGWQRAPANYMAKGSPEAKEYVAAYKAKTGRYPSDWSTLAHDCVVAWAHAANVAKSVEPDAVMKAIETSDFDSPRGHFRFGKFDHQAEVPVYFGKVAQSKEFGQAVLDISAVVAGKDSRPSEAAVKAMRGN